MKKEIIERTGSKEKEEIRKKTEEFKYKYKIYNAERNAGVEEEKRKIRA